jgi:leucyl aminopeptidase
LGIKEGHAIAEGMNLTKDLGNLPPNICTPTYLANQAKNIAKDFKMKSTILGQKQIEKLKMGSFLSVAKGSRLEPKFIIIEHKKGKKSSKPVVLVGKGITFDSGGISLKPGAAMDEMKYDMCGAATVLGVMKTIGLLNLPLNVVGLIPACENMPDGLAVKPGDIVTSMSGQTIEILNTDA